MKFLMGIIWTTTQSMRTPAAAVWPRTALRSATTTTTITRTLLWRQQHQLPAKHIRVSPIRRHRLPATLPAVTEEHQEEVAEAMAHPAAEVMEEEVSEVTADPAEAVTVEEAAEVTADRAEVMAEVLAEEEVMEEVAEEEVTATAVRPTP